MKTAVDTSFFTIMSTEKFREQKEQFAYHKEMLHSMSSIRYCKAEIFRDCMTGTIRLPQKNDHKKVQLAFGFYLTGDRIYFIEDEGKLKPWIEKRVEIFRRADTPAQLMQQMMEYMIEEDSMFFSHMESVVDQLEEKITDGSAADQDVFWQLTKYRQKLSEFNVYYEQLIDIGELFGTYSGCTEQDIQGWNRFMHRAERLQNHVQLLRENVLEIRELYQSMKDAQGNKIMGIITIITTIFLPLTLVTGWYGMNFTYMPELKWRYGYVAVIIGVLVIVILEIAYFKKKKFF